MIADRGLFAWLERDARAWRAPRARADARLVARCCRIKARFVAADERETAARAALNFGHTLGHALEGDGRNGLLHGEAVGLGMLAACGMAARMGVASPLQRLRLARLLTALGLPTRAARGAAPAALRRAWRRDKKARGGRPRFVLTPRIGAVSLGHEIPDAMIVDALRGILASHPVSNPLADARRKRGAR
jgi:3-dehydroquinate synthase